MQSDTTDPGISWVLQFRARIDGTLIRLHSSEAIGWELSIRAGALFLEGSTNSMAFALDMEDTASLTDGTWHARPCGSQDSHRILQVSRANAYLVIPAESGSLEAGEIVTVQPFTDAFL